MSSLISALRQETAFVYAPQPQQTLTPPWASQSPSSSNTLYNFTLQSVGGAVFLNECVPSAQPERGLLWQIENSATGALHLTEFTVHGGATAPRTTVEAPFQLFPALAATGTGDGRLILAALLSNGYLLHMQLRCSAAADAVLSGLSASGLRPLDLTAQLAPLGTPTSLSATPEAVLIGGSNGSVLCIPLATLDDGNTSRCFELRDSSWALTKLIPGVLYRPRQPAALACVPVSIGHRQLLLVSYDDCMLRVFQIARHHQIATLELEVPAAGSGGHGGSARSLVPTYITAETAPSSAAAGAASALGVAASGGTAAAVALVVQFEASDTLRRYTYVYTLAASAAGRMSLSNPTELAVEEGGVVAEAKVSADTVWLLIKSQGRAKVLGYSRSSAAVVSSVLLAEAAGEHPGASGAAGNGSEVDQELWEWLLQAFPQELSAEAQVCQQVLVPGQTCRASLRDALSYHGAQLSSAEVECAPHGALRGWMQTAVLAIQRRTPSASAPECWQTFLATYRAAWARRHPPLGLVLRRSPVQPASSSSSAASSEWLGLARGGSLLCMLRRGTAVEALQAAADAVCPLELPPHLDAVHRCAAEAGALLGPLAQEACLALLVAGVDPLERLMPRLCELWFGGPDTSGGSSAGASSTSTGGAAGGGGGSRAAALTDSAREAQQRWRQRRQQLVISMGQRLGGLSNVAAAVQSYLGLLRLLDTQSAAELAAAGAAGGGAAAPSKATSSFLVATCRQVSRAAAAAARDAALLLGLVRQQCTTLGTVSLDRTALARLEEALLPEACGLLRRSALGLWLTGTPSSQDEATDMEPALNALRHLRLGSSNAAAAAAAKRGSGGGGAAAHGATAAGTGGAAAAAAGDNGSGNSSGGGGGDVSLAGRLLPAFCGVYGASRGRRVEVLAGAEAAGLLFTLYLQYGEQPGASLAGRVLQLGYQLFQAGEYGNLAELSALAGATGSAEAGPQFLRGLGITCALALERQGTAGTSGTGPHPTAVQQQQQPAAATGGAGGSYGSTTAVAAARRAERIAEAAGCFFRAAAGLATDAGETLRNILRDLRSELAGGAPQLPQFPPAAAAAASSAAAVSGAAGAPSLVVDGATGASGQQQQQLQQQQLQKRREVALLQLQFCEAVMQLFEREGAPEGAVVFAAAALAHLRTAYGHLSDPASGSSAAAIDPTAPLLPGEDALLHAASAAAAERAAREGRLWSNMYSYCVEMRQYDRAYGALLANPLPAARLQSLRHLVHVLTQEGQLQTLCTLPFAGVAVLSSSEHTPTAAGPAGSATGCRTVSLLSEALDLLHRRAHNCDLAETPQPYKVLYDFLVCRSDYKGAARAMAAYAWRLRAEASSSEAAVSEALRAYDLAINSLSLLDPEDAWLDLTDPWLEKLAPHDSSSNDILMQHAPLTLPATPSAAAAAAAAGEGAAAMDVAGGGGSSGVAAATARAAAPVATVQSLQRERTMLHYCAMVAARVAGLEPMRQWDNEDAILRQLLLMGRYEGALALVADCFAGQGGDPWVKAMETVVSALAAHCTRLQLQDGGVPTGGPPLPPTDLFVDDLDGGAAAAGLGAAGAAAVAGTLGGRAAPLWAKLRRLLTQMAEADVASELQQQNGGGSGTSGALRVGWMLRDAAAEAVLRTDPRVDLPQWLLDMFLVPAPPAVSDSVAPMTAGMGCSACGPASLLSLYLRHDRLASAVELVVAQVERWSRTDVRQRRQHSAAWMPYPQLELLHTKLTIAQQLGQERSTALLEHLNTAIAAHLSLVSTDTERLQEQQHQTRQIAGGAAQQHHGMGGMVEDMGGAAPSSLVLMTPFAAAVSTPMMTPIGGGASLFGGVSMGPGLRLFG